MRYCAYAKTKLTALGTLGFKQVFGVFFVCFFLLISTWSLATPLMASPDEAVQVTKAAAVVRGQLLGKTIGNNQSPKAKVTVPATYADLNYLTNCFAKRPDVSAACTPALNSSQSTTSATKVIYNARYQPLYYLIVGLPTLFSQSTITLYIMRLIGAALCAIFLSLAVAAALHWSKQKLMLLGVIVAATPSALFFAGMVNPIGLEVATAVCFWASILTLAYYQAPTLPKGLVAVVTLSGGTEALMRSLSPLWVLIAVIVALCVAKKLHIKRLVKNVRPRIALAVMAVCEFVGLAWILIFHATNVMADGVKINKTESNLTIIAAVLRRTTLFYKEIISFFGFLNIPSPTFVYIGWTILLIGLSVASLIYGSWRERIVFIGLVLACVFIPAAISASQARRLGIVWQGSDSLPLFVGMPILAGAIIAHSTKDRLTMILGKVSLPFVTSTAAVVSFVALYFELRRYAVGVDGPLFAIFTSGWHPPLGCLALVGSELVLLGFFVLLVIYINRPDSAQAT